MEVRRLSLIPYDPFRQMENWRRELSQFFNMPWTMEFRGPRIDVYETEDEIIAQCELPGIERKEDITINIRENLLEVRGTIRRAKEIKEENLHRQERFLGNFQRAISLPGPVRPEGARATYKNGLLEIVMPKAEPQTKRHQVDIDFQP